jgi:HK97 family phage prohead protease
MSDLTRGFLSDIEIRSGGDGRTVHGIVVPYGQVARVSDGGPAYKEAFRMGAFAKSLADRGSRPIQLLAQHDSRQFPVGRSSDFTDTAEGLRGAFRMLNTRAGDEALEVAREGAVSFSVGFRPIAQEKSGGVTVRTEAALREVSLVTFPAYEGAMVSGVRAMLDASEQALAVQLLVALSASEAQLDPICEALCAAEGALDAAQGVIAQLLGIADPDAADDAAEGDPSELADMQMSSSLTSLARRLDEAIARRGSTTSTPEAGADGPHMHPGRLIVARNNLHAALIQRGIRA